MGSAPASGAVGRALAAHAWHNKSTCRWYEKLAAAYQNNTLPFVSTILKLLCGALAVTVKLAIVQRLRQRD